MAPSGDPYYDVAEFIGGPIDGETSAMQEATPDWEVPVMEDLDFNSYAFAEVDPVENPSITIYRYERQLYLSSKGNFVYLCVD